MPASDFSASWSPTRRTAGSSCTSSVPRWRPGETAARRSAPGPTCRWKLRARAGFRVVAFGRGDGDERLIAVVPRRLGRARGKPHRARAVGRHHRSAACGVAAALVLRAERSPAAGPFGRTCRRRAVCRAPGRPPPLGAVSMSAHPHAALSSPPGRDGVRSSDAEARLPDDVDLDKKALDARAGPADRATGRAPAPAPRRGRAGPAGGPAGQGRVGEGRYDAQGVRSARPAWRRGDELQGADARRSCGTTSSGGSIGPCPAGAPSASSTAPTTRTCWWCGCAASCRSRSGGRATSRSTCSSASWSRTARSILKFLLHISREEQRERLLARLSDPEKYWKFNAGDLAERELWDQYTEAYEEVLGADQHGGGTLVRGAGGQQAGPGRAGGPDGRGDAGADGPAIAGAAARARGAPGRRSGVEARSCRRGR